MRSLCFDEFVFFFKWFYLACLVCLFGSNLVDCIPFLMSVTDRSDIRYNLNLYDHTYKTISTQNCQFSLIRILIKYKGFFPGHLAWVAENLKTLNPQNRFINYFKVKT